ncbi:MAG: hypothetical protein II352_05440 [Selenomonadaceae bacterium]|nr:hypothetical protein [Selenomonadaceae bacterium]
MIILYAVAKRFNCEAIVVTKTGVREGFMYKYVLQQNENESDIQDVAPAEGNIPEAAVGILEENNENNASQQKQGDRSND